MGVTDYVFLVFIGALVIWCFWGAGSDSDY